MLMKAHRLEAFSDGVMSIILTIMVLELKVPAKPYGDGHFITVIPVFLSYALSFVMVSIYWIHHHHLIHLVKFINGQLLWLNMHLLFWISLTPFVTAYMGQHHTSPSSITLYNLIGIACSISFFFLRRGIAKLHINDKSFYTLHRNMLRQNRNAMFFHLMAIGLSWLWTPMALFFTVLPAMMYFIPNQKVMPTLKDTD
jgi:uncharacterized membrane protein